MTLDEIDAKLDELEKERMDLTAKMHDLHAQRGAITDEAFAKATLDGMTPSQRDVIIKAAALNAEGHLPAAN